ncbi:anti-sigma-F factor Fin [Paenibacillus sp. DYY-L-2]|uniref:anti-sigma-F factor Fin n=1 Tax=Paenibacillus sp. DYY-L-2 TaxID=3447013 RepID=UPI003F4FCAB2
MAVNYVCRHCRTFVGRIDAPDITESQLGFHFLTPDERRDIIAYDSNGETTVRVTCDYCREALENNPELSLLANPLQ